jgi:hypothetical protein
MKPIPITLQRYSCFMPIEKAMVTIILWPEPYSTAIKKKQKTPLRAGVV